MSQGSNDLGAKQYRCGNCRANITVIGDVSRCPQCDGELVLCDARVSTFCKIQHLLLDDGSEELLVSGHLDTHAFRYEHGEWQPMGLVDIFKPLAKISKSTGRIF